MRKPIYESEKEVQLYETYYSTELFEYRANGGEQFSSDYFVGLLPRGARVAHYSMCVKANGGWYSREYCRVGLSLSGKNGAENWNWQKYGISGCPFSSSAVFRLPDRAILHSADNVIHGYPGHVY